MGVHGKNTVVYANGVDFTKYLDQVGIAGESETAEVRTFGVDWVRNKTGLKKPALSGSGLFDGSTGAIDEILYSAFSGNTSVVFTVLPAGDSTGAVARNMETRYTEYSASAPADGLVSFSLAGVLDSTKGLDSGKVLYPLTAASSGALVVGADTAAAETVNGGFATIQCSALTAASLDASILSSSDGTTAAAVTHASFTQITSAPTAERVALSGTLKEQVWAECTIGAGGSATFHLNFSRS